MRQIKKPEGVFFTNCFTRKESNVGRLLLKVRERRNDATDVTAATTEHGNGTAVGWSAGLVVNEVGSYGPRSYDSMVRAKQQHYNTPTSDITRTARAKRKRNKGNKSPETRSKRENDTRRTTERPSCRRGGPEPSFGENRGYAPPQPLLCCLLFSHNTTHTHARLRFSHNQQPPPLRFLFLPPRSSPHTPSPLV